MDIATWNDALDDMGAAASPADLWRHWALCPDLNDQGAELLFDYLIATAVAMGEAAYERTLRVAKCSEYTSMRWCRKGCLWFRCDGGGHAA